MNNPMIVAETLEEIDILRFASLKAALRLEIAGMKRRGRSAYSIVKQEYGFKGSRQKVFDQMQKIVDDLSKTCYHSQVERG